MVINLFKSFSFQAERAMAIRKATNARRYKLKAIKAISSGDITTLRG